MSMNHFLSANWKLLFAFKMLLLAYSDTWKWNTLNILRPSYCLKRIMKSWAVLGTYLCVSKKQRIEWRSDCWSVVLERWWERRLQSREHLSCGLRWTRLGPGQNLIIKQVCPHLLFLFSASLKVWAFVGTGSKSKPRVERCCVSTAGHWLPSGVLDGKDDVSPKQLFVWGENHPSYQHG